ncbi:transcription repressor OFP13-like [Salvia miltiorrhiza]|uniref:transcription repressor OFP13-like n=1 Tax=Salvia miltiorrhiza TaxID=226208 RepID=UPI0025AC3D56|nr:transcription repressor OFP13-like [Salvia miltiorrhiza]
MPKKMKIIPSFFKNYKQCPSPCTHPKTLSFRGHDARCDDDLSPATEDEASPQPARLSERLFFEPEETSSIVPRPPRPRPFKGSVAMAVESEDPYVDFKRSMEEMVESQGLFKDWDCLEELLLWYLRMNGKMNHGFIVGAFVDLLVGFAAVESKKMTATAASAASDSTSATMYSSASSSFSSPYSSPLSHHDQL